MFFSFVKPRKEIQMFHFWSDEVLIESFFLNDDFFCRKFKSIYKFRRLGLLHHVKSQMLLFKNHQVKIDSQFTTEGRDNVIV